MGYRRKLNDNARNIVSIIEISNFLCSFIQKMKSAVASDAVKSMNADMNIKAYTDGVLPETEHIFDDKFFEQLDGVVNALDNVKARKISMEIEFY